MKSHPPTNPLTASISIGDGFPKSGIERERGEVFGKRMTSVSINKRAGYPNLTLNERSGITRNILFEDTKHRKKYSINKKRPNVSKKTKKVPVTFRLQA